MPLPPSASAASESETHVPPAPVRSPGRRWLRIGLIGSALFATAVIAIGAWLWIGFAGLVERQQIAAISATTATTATTASSAEQAVALRAAIPDAEQLAYRGYAGGVLIVHADWQTNWQANERLQLGLQLRGEPVVSALLDLDGKLWCELRAGDGSVLARGATFPDGEQMRHLEYRQTVDGWSYRRMDGDTIVVDDDDTFANGRPVEPGDDGWQAANHIDAAARGPLALAALWRMRVCPRRVIS